MPPKSPSPSIDLRIRRLLAELTKEDLRTDITVDRLAKQLRLSSSRFRHLFAQATGVSFARYLKQRRLAEARYLMEDSLLSVKEVTAAVGINDVSHFVRDYKRLYGERPSDSRHKQRLTDFLVPAQTLQSEHKGDVQPYE
jgi:transcriptional regulator GlxA family with amidase domain